MDLPYFAKYRIDKSEFTTTNSEVKRAASSFATAPARRRRDRRARRYFAYQKKRAVELPPPTKPNRISIECYGLTMARGGGWIGSCLCGKQHFTARSTPSARRLLDGVAMPVPHRSMAPDTLVDFHTGYCDASGKQTGTRIDPEHDGLPRARVGCPCHEGHHAM